MTTIEIPGTTVRSVRRPPSRRSSATRRVLLWCGILAPVLYAAMLVLVPMQWPGYSSASQAVSELSAIDAPTRALWVWLGRVYTVFALAFGVGVGLSAGQDRRLRVVGSLLVAQGLVGLFWPPMHLRGESPTLTDAMHVAFSVAWLVLMLLSMAFATGAFGMRFRLYSATTLAVFIVFGTLTRMDGPRIAANLPTPRVGVWERINIGASLVWVVILSTMLLRRSSEEG